MTVLVDLSKLSVIVKIDVVKKTVYVKLVTKVNSIDANAFVLKKSMIQVRKKIPDTSGLVKKTDCNAKLTELENKIPNVSSLATKTALTTVENKIPSTGSLFKKNRL